MAHAGPVLRQVDVRQIAQHARRVVPRVGRRVFLAHVQLKPAVREERVAGREEATQHSCLHRPKARKRATKPERVFLLFLLCMHEAEGK